MPSTRTNSFTNLHTGGWCLAISHHSILTLVVWKRRGRPSEMGSTSTAAMLFCCVALSVVAVGFAIPQEKNKFISSTLSFFILYHTLKFKKSLKYIWSGHSLFLLRMLSIRLLQNYHHIIIPTMYSIHRGMVLVY